MATPRKPQTSTQPRERTQAAPVGGPTRERIAARAYEIWEKSGRPQGKDQENWFRAEQELKGGRV